MLKSKMVASAKLYYGQFGKITKKWHTGNTLLNFTNHYICTPIDDETRLFLDLNGTNFIDVLTCNSYKRYKDYTDYELEDLVILVKDQFQFSHRNVPTEISIKEVYEYAKIVYESNGKILEEKNKIQLKRHLKNLKRIQLN